MVNAYQRKQQSTPLEKQRAYNEIKRQSAELKCTEDDKKLTDESCHTIVNVNSPK